MVNTDPSIFLNLRGHKKAITDVTFHPNEEQVATSSEDHAVMIWNIKQYARTYNFVGHTDIVTSLEYSSDGHLLASCSEDTTVQLINPTAGSSTNLGPNIEAMRTLSFKPDDSKLVAGGDSGLLKQWDLNSKRITDTFKGHNGSVKCTKFSWDGNLLASCCIDQTVNIWDSKTKTLTHSFSCVNGLPNYLSIHRNGYSVIVAMNSGSVRMYDLRNKKMQQHYVLHDNTTCVCWHPNANYFLTSGLDGNVRIVDVMQGRPIYTLRGHEEAVKFAKFSTSGNYFASGGAEKLIMMWKTNFISEE